MSESIPNTRTEQYKPRNWLMGLLRIERPPVIYYEHGRYGGEPITLYRLPEPFKLTDDLARIDFTSGREEAVEGVIYNSRPASTSPLIRAAEVFAGIPDVSAIALNGCEIAVLGGSPSRDHAKAIRTVAREAAMFFGSPRFVPHPEDTALNPQAPVHATIAE